MVVEPNPDRTVAPAWPPALEELFRWTTNRAPDAVAMRRRMAVYLDAFPTPEGMAIVTITGTNGKGSVCAMLEACAVHAGVSVGMFTSPHLWAVTERFRINGSEVPADVLDLACRELRPALERLVERHGGERIPSFFEVLLLLALQLFARANVRLVILEAGIGGASDATGCVRAGVSAITSIGFDHCAQLGDSLEEIAADKAGITRSGTLVIAPTIPEELRTYIATQTRASTRVAGCEGIERRAAGAWGHDLNIASVPVRLPLAGAHQLSNLYTARGVLEVLVERGVFNHMSAVLGVAHTRWPGRLESIGGWLLDVAHNPQGLAVLAAALDEWIPRSRRVIVYGCAEGKDLDAAVGAVRGLGERIWLVGGFYRSVERARLERALGDVALGYFDTPEACVRQLAGQADVVATGSVFLVGAVRACLVGR